MRNFKLKSFYPCVKDIIQLVSIKCSFRINIYGQNSFYEDYQIFDRNLCEFRSSYEWLADCVVFGISVKRNKLIIEVFI